VTIFGKLKKDKFSQNIIFQSKFFFQKMMKIRHQKKTLPWVQLLKMRKNTLPNFYIQFSMCNHKYKKRFIKFSTSYLVES